MAAGDGKKTKYETFYILSLFLRQTGEDPFQFDKRPISVMKFILSNNAFK